MDDLSYRICASLKDPKFREQVLSAARSAAAMAGDDRDITAPSERSPRRQRKAVSASTKNPAAVVQVPVCAELSVY
jgi:hypothetical protein